MKKLIIGIVILFLISLILRIAREWEYKPEVEEPKVDKLGLVLDKLSMCESSGRENIKILDSNNLYSYGLLQFQEGTFISYAKRYNAFPFAEDSEIMNFIYDGESQKLVARKMLEEDINNLSHWKNCTVKNGLKELALK